MIADLFLIVIGLGGGIAVGSGMAALFTVLDIIPRLAQLSRTQNYVPWFEGAIVAGALFWTWADFAGVVLRLPEWAVGVHGFFAGCFVGLLAAALTEVLNVLPILAKRVLMVERIVVLLMAMVLGKVFGSLFQWLVFEK
ncbi:stage V sporulation protein AB [Calditerricola satsumensis]|uniref:Stage V sporulation protein AB n=1 Tax=Calditerricola satsumensis TaxID=373054 RepID=A0A8J3B857_9BACI|nr:stage V sporulation protein AB [Calditerricola satsumensis]GGK00354.1 stage V sporulation protein AB [Calditerricola satsumensis]